MASIASPDADAVPPSHTQVLIIGGGPAGSTAASALAREGLHVVLLEMAQFPRYHIGESLIPSVRHYLQYIGAEEKVMNHGFVRKPGSAIKFNQYMQEGYTDFVALGEHNAVWNVKRSEFDHLLLKHAEESGASVFQSCRVVSLGFEEEDDASVSAESEGNSAEERRPVSASYVKSAGVKGEITFDYVIDASGRAGIMSTKHLKNRHYNSTLKNVAVWGYWRGTGMYGKGTDRENAPFFEALSDESGWAWFIPLANDLTSVGVVMDQKQLGTRSRACSSATNSSYGESVPMSLHSRPRLASIPLPPILDLPTRKSSPLQRPRACSSASGSFYRGSSSSVSSIRPVTRHRASSASYPGSSFVLPATLELQKDIQEVDSEDTSCRMPGDFPSPSATSTSSPATTNAYPSPPPTPLSSTFSVPSSRASSTPTSPTSARFTFNRLRSPSVTGEEIPSRKASALADKYLSFLNLAPGVLELIGEEGVLVKVDEDGKEVGAAADAEKGEAAEGANVPVARTASDYSYSASKYAGKGYRIIGDAGAFIDPFFSSGIHLAMTGALSAAASICASVRGDCTETEAAEWCSRRIAISYTRFLVVVLSAYKQIRAQSMNVLADMDDDNFDKAFKFLRPVIQGSGEMGAKISENEVQRALDFCVNLFNPTTPEQHKAVEEKLNELQITAMSDQQDVISEEENDEKSGGPPPSASALSSWMDVRAPIVSPTHLTKMLKMRLRSMSGSGFGSSTSSPPPSLSSVSSLGYISPPPPTSSDITLSSIPPSSSPPISQLDCVSELAEENPHNHPSNQLHHLKEADKDKDTQTHLVDRAPPEDSEMKMVLDKVNARRVIHVDHMEGLNSLEQEDVEGFVVRLVKGQLGLVRSMSSRLTEDGGVLNDTKTTVEAEI